jgi:hypothetical protein
MNKPLPIIIGLAGAEGSGRRTIAQHLKRRHGFASHRFAQPLFDAVQFLYGVSPVELLCEDHGALLERLGKRTTELLNLLRAHAAITVGNDILIRRLVERLAARGEWMQDNVVITDVTEAMEIRWIRQMRGRVWWVRRPGAEASLVPHIEKLFLELYEPHDALLINDGSQWILEQRVDQALSRAMDAAKETA